MSTKRPSGARAYTDTVRWWRNGDHPDDRVGEILIDPVYDALYTREEGAVVRYFRRPGSGYGGEEVHVYCDHRWHRHGWVDCPGGGLIVCPGDSIAAIDEARAQAVKDRP